MAWHRTRVVHRYWEMEQQRSSDGSVTHTRVERADTVSEIASAAPFVVRDATGDVTISPDGADVDAAERTVDRFETYLPDSAPAQGGLAGLVTSVLRARRDSATLGFDHEE